MDGKVLITGGAGFLGRGILRRAQREGWSAQLAVMSRDEAKHIRIQSTYPGVRTIKGDVSDDVDFLARLLSGYDVVIHAGANKLVDVGERSAFEVVKNNVFGSEHLARAAMKAGVGRVIGISSDKAVQPVNTYGMSKAIMERIFQEADSLSPTDFVCARYGNVVGSTISIVLYFRDQLRETGRINVTDPNMTRFYMGVDEAIDAILYALRAKPGSVVIPSMMAMSVADVAKLVLKLDPDVPLHLMNDERVNIVGARPGEKLHECLLHEQESIRVLRLREQLEPGQGEDTGYYELRPPVEKGFHPPFTITSDQPPLGWMSWVRMESLIADAETL